LDQRLSYQAQNTIRAPDIKFNNNFQTFHT